jgi:hypothetical protein
MHAAAALRGRTMQAARTARKEMTGSEVFIPK